MQNPNDGRLESITGDTAEFLEGFFKETKKVLSKLTETGVKFQDGSPVMSNVVMFKEGEVYEINGGLFKLKKIKAKKNQLLFQGTIKKVSK